MKIDQNPKIREQIINVISSFLDKEHSHLKEEQLERSLHVIMSHSVQAIHFITSIEEEFGIEIDDDGINLDNFLNINNLEHLIGNYLR